MTSFINNDVASGDIVRASDHNEQGARIAAVLNGGVGATNLESNAVTTAKIADSNITTAKYADDSVTDAKLDYPRWWQEVGRTTLTVAGDTITVSSIPARKYLMFQITTAATGGTINAVLTFNGDTATNYSTRVSDNFGAGAAAASQSSIGLANATSTDSYLYIVEMANISAVNKLARYCGIRLNAAGAASAPEVRQGFGKWANTSAQISSVTITNTGTGDYAIGSEVVVLGHD